MPRTAQVILGTVGISAGTPFTLGTIPRITQATPPVIADSIMKQVGSTVITVGTDPAAAATETLRLSGGIVSDTGVGHKNVIMGQGATAQLSANAFNTVIGTSSSTLTAGVATDHCTIVGASIAVTQDIGTLTLIGNSIIIGAGSVTAGAIMIGSGMTPTNSASGPCIGTGANQQGAGVLIGNQSSTSAVNNYVCIGRSSQENAGSCTVIGDNARAGVGHTFSILLGRNAVSLAANTLVAGATGGSPISQVLIGAGDTGVGGQAVTYRHTNGSGADNPAASVRFQAGLGTGSAATLGRIEFATGAPAGSSSTVQTATVQFSILPSAGGANAPNVRFDNVTNAAAANTGTLTNSPVTGNPNFWLPVSIAGTTRFIPCF